MALNSFTGILLFGTLILNHVHASDRATDEMNKKYLTITKVKVSRIESDVFNQEVSSLESVKNVNMDLSALPGMPDAAGQASTANIGKIIAIGKDLVALGESIYTLVQKGKPNLNSTYAPISVLPVSGNGPIDIFETENWKTPKKYSYSIAYENGFGMEVVSFRYDVVYAYGGSFDGRGAYLTAAQIIPVKVNTSFGFDFSATMKLNGLQNHGTKANPVAGAILTMQYEISTVVQASLESSTFHVMGNGGFKKL